MKKAIIITTINPIDNTSIKDFKKYDFDIIIVGDLKTPHNDYVNNKDVIYLHPTKFNEFSEFSKNLPFNHYTRKNIGYLYAIKNVESVRDLFRNNVEATRKKTGTKEVDFT